MSKTATLGLLCALGVSGGLFAASAVGAADTAPSGSRSGIVTEPIAEPAEDVDPAVAAEMNKPGARVAEGVPMRKAPKVNAADLIGEGRGDGCTKGYGKGGECLPITPPSAVEHGMTVEQHPWTCTEVRTLFDEGIKVTGKGDPLRLDFDQNGVACDTGDV